MSQVEGRYLPQHRTVWKLTHRRPLDAITANEANDAITPGTGCWYGNECKLKKGKSVPQIQSERNCIWQWINTSAASSASSLIHSKQMVTLVVQHYFKFCSSVKQANFLANGPKTVFSHGKLNKQSVRLGMLRRQWTVNRRVDRPEILNNTNFRCRYRKTPALNRRGERETDSKATKNMGRQSYLNWCRLVTRQNLIWGEERTQENRWDKTLFSLSFFFFGR